MSLEYIDWSKYSVYIKPNEDISIKDIRLVICGCSRDNEQYLHRVLTRLKKLETCFKEVAYIFAENDSKDNTLQILKDFKSDNVTVLSYPSLTTTFPRRTHRLAFCRNKIVETAFEKYGDYDYLLMVDMDNVLAGTDDINGLFSPFSYDLSRWDVMTASSNDESYYDLWALRIPGFIDFDLWHIIFKYNIQDYRTFISQFDRKIPIDLNPIKVKSAFGGAAYYKLKSLKGHKYDGNGDFMGEGCEHVTLHKSMNCNIFIDPKFKL